MANVIILAEYAHQVAVGKKDGPGATRPDQWRFFPEMWIKARYPRLRGCFAKPGLTGQTIDLTAAGTQAAILQNLPGRGYPLAKQTLPNRFDVCRDHDSLYGQHDLQASCPTRIFSASPFINSEIW